MAGRKKHNSECRRKLQSPLLGSRYDVKVDLHGYTGDEAIVYLEELVLVHASSSLEVIHGIGTGVLKNVVREFGKSSKSVKSMEFGENLNSSGGFGQTILYTL